MNLPVREDKQRGVYVAGATEEYVTSADEVMRESDIRELQPIGLAAVANAPTHIYADAPSGMESQTRDTVPDDCFDVYPHHQSPFGVSFSCKSRVFRSICCRAQVRSVAVLDCEGCCVQLIWLFVVEVVRNEYRNTH